MGGRPAREASVPAPQGPRKVSARSAPGFLVVINFRLRRRSALELLKSTLSKDRKTDRKTETLSLKFKLYFKIFVFTLEELGPEIRPEAKNFYFFEKMPNF